MTDEFDTEIVLDEESVLRPAGTSNFWPTYSASGFFKIIQLDQLGTACIKINCQLRDHIALLNKIDFRGHQRDISTGSISTPTSA